MAFGRTTTRAARTTSWIGLTALVLATAPAGASATPARPAPPARSACTIVGTPGPDVLTGTPGRDVICGRGGDDRIDGGAGDDVISGGPGDDVIAGGPGDDVLWGSGGDDLLRGGGGADQLYGGAGNDLLRGGVGADQLRGGPGDDRLQGGRGDDDLRGGPGKDRLDGGADEQGPPTPPPPPPAPKLPGAPVAVDDTVGTDEDTALDLSVGGAGSPAANDTDPDGDPLAVTGVASPAGGTVQLAGTTIRFHPEADLCGPGAGHFDYTVDDGTGRTDTGRVTVDITCLADDPTARDDDATVAEDADATAVPVLANDADADGDPLVIASVTQPTHGTVVITGGGAGLTYRPATNHCTTPPGTTPETFTYTLTPGGATAAVSVAVTCVDDPPVAVGDTETLTEDDPATAIDVLANDADVDGGDKRIASVTQPAHGTVVVTGGGTGLTYEPDADYCNAQPAGPADTFGYTLAPGGDDANVVVVVTCVDDAPVAVDDTRTVTEDSAATSFDVLANDTDVEGDPFTIGSITQPTGGTVVVTGGGTGLSYEPDPDHCTPAPAYDSFTYTLAPGGDEATVRVTVTCVADAPVAHPDVVTLAEDDPATAIPVLANDVDADDDPLAIASVTQPAHGTVVVTGGGTGLTYAPDADFCTTGPGGAADTFTYTLADGPTTTVSVTVTCVEDLSEAVDDDVTIDEDAVEIIAALANDRIGDTPPSITAVGTPGHGTATTNGATITYTPDADYCTTGPGGASDTFTYTITGGSTATVAVTITCVAEPAVAVDDTATVTEDDPATAIPVLANDLDPDGTGIEITAVTQPVNGSVVITGGGTGLTYEPDADYCNAPPGTAPDTFGYTVTGGDTAQVTVTVTCVIDPAVAKPDAATATEDTAATIDVLANDLPGDLDPVVTQVGQPSHGTTAIDGTRVTYTPAANYCNDPPGTTLDSFGYTITGGSTATVTVTVTCVNDAPTAAPLSVGGADAAVGNTVLVVDDPTDAAMAAGGPHKSLTRDLLAGATDVETAGSLAVVPGTVTTTAGGSVALEADGDFRYTPPTGCVATGDTFTYSVTDQDPAGARTATATVSIALAGCVWYVSNDAAGDAGTSTAPFNTLAQAQAASLAGQTIYVLGGDGTGAGYDAGVTLKADQRLVGQAVALSIGTSTLAPAVPSSRPRLTAMSGSVVNLNAGNTVTGLLLDPSGAGSAIDGGSTDIGGTLTDLRIIDTGAAATQAALRLAGTSGTFVVGDLVVDNTAATGVTSGSVGVELTSTGTVTFTPSTTISITTAGAKALSVVGTTLTGSAFDDITVTGSGSGGVSLVGAGGPVTFGRLALRTISGATPALSLQSTGAITVPDTGSSTLDANGGPAIDVATALESSLAFASVSSTGSAGRGIRLSGLGGGSFVAHDGTVTGHTGAAFVVDGGSGAVTYDGTLANGAGRSLEVTGRTGGTVTISKKVTDSADDGGGLLVSGNLGGSTVLSAAGTTLDTGTGDAIAFTNNGAGGGHTLRLTGGSLGITTTSGKGVDASGGTLVVTGTVNRISSGTGRALGLTATRIGADDLTFERISSTGAPNGIVLNGTGDAGSLVVTGAGGTCTAADTSGCTGGKIAGSTGGDDSGTAPAGTGIVLTDTATPSLTRMWVQDAGNYGLRGDRTRGLTLTHSVVNGVIGTSGVTPYDESTVLLTNLSGTASITDTFLAGGLEDTLRVTNVNTSLVRLTLDRVTFGSAGGRPENDAIALDSSGTGDFPVTISNSTVQGAAGDLLQYGHSASGAGDLVLTANSFVNAHPAISSGGGGVTVYQDGAAGGTTMNITGNTFRGAVGTGVLIAKGPGAARQQGTFANNTIGASGVADSGSLSGSALKLQQLGRGSIEWAVTGNQIRGYNNYGVEVLAGGGAGAEAGVVNTVVTGNVISEPGTAAATATLPKQGVHYNVGTRPGDTFEVCADVRDNDLGGSGALGSPITDVLVRQRQNTRVHVPGAVGTGTAAAEARIVAANPTNLPVVRATADLPASLDGASCPVLPAP
ncbi:tandem-95 repeat protein [Nocardioides carbamazepini]|uniref:Ig-like domain-containing protein n=1 Tax=Nocardioides carbamazepini TaxID=2854259 RepID=UPI00214A500C|nr:Ig-like domain-containing protein [Nocardioides carbamazepini]MCR1782297.1 tandem-95 repeat protein [Nocardioides carbamazepini]